jgi:hypothetical protein
MNKTVTFSADLYTSLTITFTDNRVVLDSGLEYREGNNKERSVLYTYDEIGLLVTEKTR